MCVIAYVWGSEENFRELFLSIMWVPEIKVIRLGH